jgi:hypothetical protein
MTLRVQTLAIFIFLHLLARAALAENERLPLSAPAKILPSANAEASPVMQRPSMIAQPARPQPTTPGGKLPQYQLDHERRAVSTSDLDNPPMPPPATSTRIRRLLTVFLIKHFRLK